MDSSEFQKTDESANADIRHRVLRQLKREAEMLRQERNKLAMTPGLGSYSRLPTEHYSGSVQAKLDAQDEFFLRMSTPWKATEGLRSAAKRAEETIGSVVQLIELDDAYKGDQELAEFERQYRADGPLIDSARGMQNIVQVSPVMNASVSNGWPFHSVAMQVEAAMPLFM